MIEFDKFFEITEVYFSPAVVNFDMVITLDGTALFYFSCTFIWDRSNA